MIDDLNDDNFMIYAAKAYDKPNCILSEFEEDLKRLKYVKRLIKRYRISGDLKERLVLNHIIVLSNVFGVEHAVKMLFYKMDECDYDILKTFLIFLNFMPKYVGKIKNNHLYSKEISVDLFVSKRLRDI
jgi:hypothetical protein